MNAIAISLNMKSKKELIQKIVKTLDPITYISLSNGNILAAFMDNIPIIASDKSHKTLLNQWVLWIKQNNNYASKIGINNSEIQSISISDSNKTSKPVTLNISKIDPSVLSRELAIYKSYSNFINYLQSNDVKNPEYVQEVLLIIDIICLIWKRQDECSYITMFNIYKCQ
jgi:hypothetical protein